MMAAMPDSAEQPAINSHGAVLDCLLLLLLAACFAWWTWGCWPDPMVDWGMHLYLAWRVSAGEVLYRDLMSFNGPLSVWINAALFRLFGVRQHVVWIANLAILGAIIIMLYSLLRTMGGRFAANLSLVAFIIVFAFPNYTVMANYNYVTPYAQEFTHGLALNLAALCVLRRFQRSPNVLAAAGMGLLVGCCLLTRPEPALAGVVGVVVGFVLALWKQRAPIGKSVLMALVLLEMMAVPVVLAWVVLSRFMPAMMALRGIAGSWQWVFDARVRQMSFYRVVSGFDDPLGNALRMLKWSAFYLLVLGGFALAAKCIGDGRRRLLTQVGAICTGLPLWALVQLGGAQFRDAMTPLPLVILVCFVVTVVFLGKRDLVLHAAFIAFAGAILLKIALFSRVWHYGFVLAMPATLIFIVAIISWIPQWMSLRRWSAGLFQGAAFGLCIGFSFASLQWTQSNSRHDWKWVGADGDRFCSLYLRGADQVSKMIDSIDRNARDDESLAVIPHGLMVNFMTRRRHPNRYISVAEPELITCGEDAVVRAYKEHPPDWILLCAGDLGGDGFQLEGEIYGREMRKWMDQNYHYVTEEPGAIWLVLLRRNSPTK
jgi:hypothetical protein